QAPAVEACEQLTARACHGVKIATNTAPRTSSVCTELVFISILLSVNSSSHYRCGNASQQPFSLAECLAILRREGLGWIFAPDCFAFIANARGRVNPARLSCVALLSLPSRDSL